MTSVRKSLHPLQPAAMEKENQVGVARMIHADKDNPKSLGGSKENDNQATPQESKVASQKRKKVASNKRKKVVSKSIQVGNSTPVITEEDLTSTTGPSSNNWELLAEQRRLALEAALGENERLQEKTECLEEMIECLQEIIERLEEKNERLQEENQVFKEMVEETDSLVGVLKNMVNDPADDSQANIDDSIGG